MDAYLVFALCTQVIQWDRSFDDFTLINQLINSIIQVSEERLVELLEQVSSQEKKTTKVTIMRRRFDEDDEDDNDDDLL